ncbi:RCC1 domain-containing protein 1 [Collichthys lucidus]|uniref:RCC1 domain-containing protein 1 n=1 Tax=Collichthys lucidus TaxID=240159 RepID=A0A4U5UGS4_COLLU|nr:RCC1 domain-containing protein 1 [Collichthys lucidus]
MRWFGFGFNAFGQIHVGERLTKGEYKDAAEEVKVFIPAELDCCYCCRVETGCHIRASWSRRAYLHLDGLCAVSVKDSRGCKDASVSESHLTLAFSDRIETWDLQKEEKTPSWSMGITYRELCHNTTLLSLLIPTPEGQESGTECRARCPPQCLRKLCTPGDWADGGDLYVWGWNESGQLGLPSRGLRKALQQQRSQQAGATCQDARTSPAEEPQEGEKNEEVFISIQAFPALLDITPSCEIRTVSCGSRHTAAVTSDYGQLGHQTLISSDEPQRVEFFREQHMRVVDVVCGAWNTFAAVVKEEVA